MEEVATPPQMYATVCLHLMAHLVVSAACATSPNGQCTAGVKQCLLCTYIIYMLLLIIANDNWYIVSCCVLHAQSAPMEVCS